MVADKFSLDGKSEIELHSDSIANRSSNDAEEPKFREGEKVRLLADVVNDGTYPHAPIGALMMEKGCEGYVKSIGEFLQVIRVYEVHFLGYDKEVEIIGCREHELESVADGYDMDSTESHLFKKMIEEKKKNKS